MKQKGSDELWRAMLIDAVQHWTMLRNAEQRWVTMSNISAIALSLELVPAWQKIQPPLVRAWEEAQLRTLTHEKILQKYLLRGTYSIGAN